jgi:hypothetical protein
MSNKRYFSNFDKNMIRDVVALLELVKEDMDKWTPLVNALNIMHIDQCVGALKQVVGDEAFELGFNLEEVGDEEENQTEK